MLNRMDPFAELFGTLRTFPLHSALQGSDNGSTRGLVPAADIHETKDAVFIELDLPGVKDSDLDVELEGKVLTLTATRSQRWSDDEAGTQRQERHLGAYRRTFTLGDSIDTEHIDAKLEDGVLLLTLPKREKERARKITVGTTTKALEA